MSGVFVNYSFELTEEIYEGDENTGGALIATIELNRHAIVVRQQSHGVPNIIIFGSCEDENVP